jgi:hypothetical protein
MASRLNALRDDGVTAVRFQESCFVDRRSGTNNFASRSLDPRHQFFFRQAIVKAHDRGPCLFDDCATGCVKWLARRVCDGRGRINAELEIVRLESFPPRVLARIAWHRHLVREKIEIERPVAGCRAKLLDLCANLLAAQHAGRQGSEPTRLCDRNRELGIRCSRHCRLEDRDVDRKKIQKRSVRPHRLAPIAAPAATLALSTQHMNSRAINGGCYGGEGCRVR